MRIFITGASGYIGSVVAEKAIEAGHTVWGLARNKEAEQRLERLGVKAVLGDLNSVTALEKGAEEADAVLHLAFVHDWTVDYAAVLETDKRAVEALAGPLHNTNKPLVFTSGTAVVEPSADGEETDEWAPSSDTFVLRDRIKAERANLAQAEHGRRIIALRLPPYVYGRGGSAFVPMLLKAAAELGVSAYVGDGMKRTSAVEVEDAARAYLLAAEKAAAGAVYNCTAETNITGKNLAEAIGEAVGVPAMSKPRAEVEQLWGAFMTAFVDFENRASSARLRTQLGWEPKGPLGLLEDITHGSYRELARNLRKQSGAAR